MHRKFASGWNTPKLPGQFFATRKDMARRLAAPYSTDMIATRPKQEGPAWQASEVTVHGDDVYDGPDKLLTIKDPAERAEFLADYRTSPDRAKTYNEWRNRLRGAEEAAGLAPARPNAKLRSGGGEDEFAVDSGRWHARAYVKRIFVPGKEAPKPGQKDKPGMIPIYHRGIEITDVETGDVVKFPMTLRDGDASFGDSRSDDKSFGLSTKPRYGPADMAGVLARWVGHENAKALVDAAMGGMTRHYPTQASWVSRQCRFASK